MTLEISKEEIWALPREEIVRLARLGLWAEEHGIPTVRMAESYCQAGAVERSPDGPGLSDRCDDALEALLKETK